ncbi:MAG: hypothetical protein J3T61_00505 [Candidatus Brocadiales bacterium]|nr:hypothetical protein [Candidatus Bathyanammoxibius sp.]
MEHKKLTGIEEVRKYHLVGGYAPRSSEWDRYSRKNKLPSRARIMSDTNAKTWSEVLLEVGLGEDDYEPTLAQVIDVALRQLIDGGTVFEARKVGLMRTAKAGCPLAAEALLEEFRLRVYTRTEISELEDVGGYSWEERKKSLLPPPLDWGRGG